ncbi:SIR2 family protein [Saccharospirillum alexandrii]|uniref:SIR2 family protein n=1 Tax=Saccharospirillum alexandrii TaxID=2448477 RepID=UPI00373674DF
MPSAQANENFLYRKPNTENWLPLNEGSLRVILGLDSTDEIPKEKLNTLAENKRAVQDLLSSALQLPNLVFFAGSGTSLGEVGGPSMWDLWNLSMCTKSDASDGDPDLGKLTKEAESVCRQVHYEERDNPNIEHFLSQCDSYLQFQSDSTIEDFVRNVKGVILNACTSFLNRPDSNISSYSGLLQKLARRRVRDPRLKVFTTNYDMCFETAASELGMMVVDGFSYTRNRRFDGKYFNYDVVRRDGDGQEFVEGIFQLFKLHGSVSWNREEKNIRETASPEPENVALIYPAKGKYQQAFMQPHLELFSRFIEALRLPNNCLLMSGFGFNDDHLSEPVLSAIKSNPSLKLIIADFKAKEHIENNDAIGSSQYWLELAQLADQGYDVHFINCSFSEFMEIIPNLRALSPAEQLAKAIKTVGK